MKTGKLFTREANRRRICFLILLFAELLILAFLAYRGMHSEKEYRGLNGEDVPSIERTIALKRGVYMIDVTYETTAPEAKVQFHMTSSRNEEVGDAVALPRQETQKTFEYILYEDAERVWLVTDAGSGELTINSVVIRGTRQMEKMELFLLFFLFVVIDLLFLFRRKWLHPYTKGQKMVGMTLAGICILTSLPLFTDYMILGHDLTFHMMRIEGLAQGILDGQLPVRIQPVWMKDYGYPVSVMYGDLLLYIPAFLRIIGLPLQMVYKIYVFAVNVITVLVSYYCAREVFQNDKFGLLGSLLYTLAGYRIVNLFYRCAVGEFSAMIFLPLIFLAFWKLFHDEKRDDRKIALLMIVGFTGVLQTHTLSAEMTVLYVLIFCLLNAGKFWKNLKFLAVTAFATIALNLAFLVPMIDYMMSVDMHVMYDTCFMQSHSIFFPQLFQTFAFGGESSGMSCEGIRGDMPFGAGWFLVLIMGLFLWEAVLYREEIKEKLGAECFRGQCRIFGVMVLAILMSCDFFPWIAIRNIPVVGVFLTPYQFAWRFLGMAVALAAALGCFAVRNLYVVCDRSIRIGLVFLLCATTIMSAQILIDRNLAEGKPQKITSGAFADSVYAVSGAEYVPMETQLELLYNTAAEGESGVLVEEYSRYKKYYYVRCSNTSEEERRLKVPILAYKGYVAVDDATGEHFEVTYNENRILQVILPAGYEGTVRVSFEEPVYWRIAELISLATLAAVVIWAVNGKFSRGKTSPEKNRNKQEKIA